MQKRTKWLMWGGVTLFLFGWLLWSNLNPVLTNIEYISETIPKAFDGYRILQVSDLHDACFGKDNSRLIKLARGTLPDLILITGDHVDSSRPYLPLLAFPACLWSCSGILYQGNLTAASESNIKSCSKAWRRWGYYNLMTPWRSEGWRHIEPDRPSGRGLPKGNSQKRRKHRLRPASRIKPGFTILLAHGPNSSGTMTG